MESRVGERKGEERKGGEKRKGGKLQREAKKWKREERGYGRSNKTEQRRGKIKKFCIPPPKISNLPS